MYIIYGLIQYERAIPVSIVTVNIAIVDTKTLIRAAPFTAYKLLSKFYAINKVISLFQYLSFSHWLHDL